MDFILIFMAAVFVNNFVLSQFLGICPFLGVSRKFETALGMGAAVTFVMTLASATAFVAYNFVLIPLGITFLYIIVFIMIIASLVQFIEIYLKKASPVLYQSLGIYLPLLTTNCAVMGVVIINRERFTRDFISSVIHGAGGGIGFMVAILLLAGIREKLEYSNIPVPFRGFPIALITTGLMAIAFMGFAGLI